jgi:DNA repair exonuclease SbcCD ATPase subunit
LENLKLQEKELSNKLSIVRQNKGEHGKIKREINKIQNYLKTYKKKLLGPSEIEKIGNEIKNLTDIIGLLYEEIMQIETNLSASRDLEKYNTNKKEIKKLNKNKEDIEEKYNILRDRIKGAIGLHESAREAEFLSIAKVINDINNNAKIYLDAMFEHDITVEIFIKETTKTGKMSAKPSISTFIEYKNEISDMDDLSAGERQRCDLAFLLAVNDLLGSNVLLLDECFNNLDSATNMDILNFVKDLCKDKLIIVVAHEAIKGLFDNVISF